MVLDSEDEEILGRVANQSHEIESLRARLVMAERRNHELTMKLMEHEESQAIARAPISSTPHSVTVAPQDAIAPPLPDPPNPRPANTTPKAFVIKAKDIPILKMSEIGGLGAEDKAERFIELVEYCVSDGEDRIQVANTRLEFEILTLLKQQMTESSDPSWENFKGQLKTIFRGTKLHENAFREVMALTYHPDEMPRAFANRFKCKMAAFSRRFPEVPTPKIDRTIKKKLLEGVPSIRGELSFCTGDEYPLDTFLDRFENAMRSANLGQARSVWTVTPTPQSNSTSAPAPETSKPTELQELRQKMDQMLEDMKRVTRDPRPRRKWCPYCRSAEHFLKDCPHNPPRGVCFDCQSPDHRRGAPNCPGRGGQNN